MWSKQYLAVPFRDLTRNWYQAIADTDSTVITFPGGGQFLDAGGFAQFNATIGLINSTYPIQLIQLGQVHSIHIFVQFTNPKGFSNLFYANLCMDENVNHNI